MEFQKYGRLSPVTVIHVRTAKFNEKIKILGVVRTCYIDMTVSFALPFDIGRVTSDNIVVTKALIFLNAW